METTAIYSIERKRFEVYFVDDTTRPKKAFGWILPLTDLQQQIGQVQIEWLAEAIDAAKYQVDLRGGFEKFAFDVPPGAPIPFANSNSEWFAEGEKLLAEQEVKV